MLELFPKVNFWEVALGPPPGLELILDPHVLTCLGAELDAVSQCTGFLPGLLERYYQRPELIARFDATYRKWEHPTSFFSDHISEALATAYVELIEEIWLPSMVDEDILPVFGFRSVEEVKQHINPDYVKGSLWNINKGTILRIHRAWQDTARRQSETNMTDLHTSHILVRTAGGRVAIVPKWTQCGDIIAGLLLPTRKSFYPMFTFRPIAANVVNLKALLEEKFGQQVRPIFHCKFGGECWVDTGDLKFRDEFCPQSSRLWGMAHGEEESFHSIWKEIMAGDSSQGLKMPDQENSAAPSQTNTTETAVKWHTFAIH